MTDKKTILEAIMEAKNLVNQGRDFGAMVILEDLMDKIGAPGDGRDDYKTIAVDLDGVLAKYGGYKGPYVIGPPIDGAREFLATLKARGLKIIVYSTRGECEIKDWLRLWNMISLVDEININSDAEQNNHGKPLANFYVDDRAIRFTGDYDSVLKEINEFKDWWRLDAL